MSAEMTGTVAAELPAADLAALPVYPDRRDAAALAAEAQVVFLDVVSDPNEASAILNWLAAEVPGTPVIVLLRSNDPDLILNCLRSGAAEFLIQPFTREQLAAVLRKLGRFAIGLQNARGGGKVYCVAPGKGACGATTLACNLAFALKRQTNERVLLADLDGLTGTVAFMLKLKTQYSFLDAVNHSGALDPDVWKALVTPAHGIDVLLSPEDPVDCYAESFNPAMLIASARLAYSSVVVDTGGTHGEWNSMLARLADELILVTTNELPALHATQRALAAFERNGIGREKSRVVLNRFQPKFGLSEEEIARALGCEIFRTIPSDSEAISKAVMEGKAAVPTTQFGRSITGLAQALSGASAPVKRERSVFSRLFSYLP